MWVLGLTMLSGCSEDRPAIDISGTPLPADHREVNWMEVLDNLPKDKNRAKQWTHLQSAFPTFWQAWSEDILQLGAAQDTLTVDVVHDFLTQMAPMILAIDSTSGSPEVLQSASNDLHDGLKRLSVIDPSTPMPDVVWMPSGFNFAVYPGPDWLAVGLDWFMGAEHPMHAELPPTKFPAYRLARMRPDRMTSEAMIGWLLVTYQDRLPSAPRTVDMWLYWGKIMHTAARCMPDATPAQLMNWTQEEWDWAVAHERSTWAEMQPQDRMFANKPRDVMRWFQEGPFTRVGRVPQDSPDRLGVFLGWRAVEAALAQHPEWTDADVLEWTDPQPVLRAYRP